jgi:hypothetical protein
MEEDIAAAERYYQIHQRPFERLASSGNAALHLQRTTLVGNRHATHPFHATMSAGFAAGGNMPAVLTRSSDLMLIYAQFTSKGARLLSFPIANQVPRAWGQAGAGNPIRC